MKYESNPLIFSKGIEQKQFFILTDRTGNKDGTAVILYAPPTPTPTPLKMVGA